MLYNTADELLNLVVVDQGWKYTELTYSRSDLAAPQPDGGGRLDHPEHAAAAAQGDDLRAGSHQASHQG